MIIEKQSFSSVLLLSFFLFYFLNVLCLGLHNQTDAHFFSSAVQLIVLKIVIFQS